MKHALFTITSTMLLLHAPLLHAQDVIEDGEELDTFTEGETEEVEGGIVETRAEADRGVMEHKAQRVEQLDARDLERRGVTTLADALAWMSAGSTVSPTGTAQGLVIDGLPSAQLMILRDGLPLARAAGSQQGPIVDLASIAINPETIERIDVYRGAGPVGSGASAGVVIDIITRRAKPGLSAFARAQTGTLGPNLPFLSQDLQGGITWSGQKEIALGMSGTYGQSEAVDVDGDSRPDSAQRRNLNTEFFWHWRPTQNDFLRLMIISNLADTESLGGPNDIFDDVVERDTLRLRAQGRWWVGQDVRLDHNLDVGLERSEFRKRVLSSGFMRLKSFTRQESAQQTVAVTWFGKHHDLAGEAFARGWRINRNGETGTLPTQEQGEVGAGLSDTLYASERTEVFTRAVWESSSAFGGGLNGQISAAYALEPERWTLRTTLSSTRRVPTAEELFLDFDHSEVGYRLTGNPELEPERLNSLQLSNLCTTQDKKLGVEVQSFVHLIDDTIVFNTVPGQEAVFQSVNAGQALIAGGQLQVQLARIIGDIDLLSNYSYLPVARERSSGNRLPQRSQHAARAEARRLWFSRKLETWADVSVRSALSVPPGSPPAPGQTLLGVGARYHISEAWQASCDVNNLLDQYDAVWGPVPGRSMWCAVKWRTR